MKMVVLMRFARLLGVALWSWSLTLHAQAPASTNTLSALQARLAEAVAQPRLAAAALGVKVVSAETGKTLFEHNAGKLLKPASNAKLYSGALALDRLGPDFRIKTSFYAVEKPDADGVLKGDLIVYGRGDPSLAARFNDGNYQKALAQLVSALTNAGIRQITGDLVGDESYFRGPPMGSGWTWDDLQYYYGAEVSALTLEDNVVDLVIKPGAGIGAPCQIVTSPATTYLTFSNRTSTVEKEGSRTGINLHRPVGENIVYVTGKMPLGASGHGDSVAVHQPARWFVTLLRDALAARGIQVGGQLRTVSWQDREAAPLDTTKLVEVAKVESRPLSEMLGKMLKPSQNLYAQLLLLQVAAQKSTNRTATTEDLGVVELGKFLTEAGIKKGDVLLEEGSGLSRSALLTPNATITLLQYMARHPHAALFREALPVAGVDGTLRSRFGGTAAHGNVRAKTGTLRYVNSISGYLTTAAKEPLIFSIMLNNYNPVNSSGRAEVDSLVLLLTGLGSRSSDGN
jgi:D-alanyl-D-alanine carboxypeptidase/D-alanyl-D-alanine-endopeptidase (penicillin-binding protein 4)